MNKRFLVLLLFVISLFLLVSAVSAEDMEVGNSNTDLDVLSEDQSVDNSADSNDNADSDDSTDDSTTDSSSPDSSVDSAIQFNDTPYKFTSTKNISSTYGKKVKFSVKVLNNEGNPINHTLVSFKVNVKTYNVYTDASGISSIYLNLNSGKYTIYYSAQDISGKNTYTVRNYYKITLYKWNSGANVLRNKRIKANVPNSALVRKIIKLAKSGTPVIKFKGGNGKVVFITAGCHGNELPSQVAAMRLIHYLETHSIKGTVYVMPFMNPKGTAANVRDYKGVRLNKLAHKKGTISYKTVQLIKKFKCDAYGDFHSTRLGGKPGKDLVPGKNLVFGSYNPTKKSAAIAKYIAKNAKVKYKIYKKAGAEYPGALEDEVNLKGIPAVTCEVLSSHGKIKKGSVYKSLLMMKTLLKYHKII